MSSRESQEIILEEGEEPGNQIQSKSNKKALKDLGKRARLFALNLVIEEVRRGELQE